MSEPPDLDQRIRDRLDSDECERRQLVAAVEVVLDAHVPTLDDSSEVDEPFWYYCSLCWRGASRCGCADRQDALYPCQPVRDIAFELDVSPDDQGGDDG